jgi:hypothetical protein
MYSDSRAETNRLRIKFNEALVGTIVAMILSENLR